MQKLACTLAELKYEQKLQGLLLYAHRIYALMGPQASPSKCGKYPLKWSRLWFHVVAKNKSLRSRRSWRNSLRDKGSWRWNVRKRDARPWNRERCILHFPSFCSVFCQCCSRCSFRPLDCVFSFVK